MTCLRSQSRSLIFCQLGGVHEKVRGQFRGHGTQAQRPLRLFDYPNGRWLLLSPPRNQRGELVVGLGEIDHVSLALQQRRHGRVQLAPVDRLFRVVPPDVAAKVVDVRRLLEVRRRSDLAEVHHPLHGRQHQVAFAHPPDEPVELFEALPAVCVRLVLVSRLDLLFEVVVAGFRDRRCRVAWR